MVRNTTLLILTLSLAACAGRGPGVLPPAPKESALAFEERLLGEASPMERVTTDTLPTSVLDATSMQSVVLPQEGRGAKQTRERHSSLAPRFEQAGSGRSDPVARVQAVTDSLRSARTPWISAAVTRDSILFHKSWLHLERRMIVGAEFPVRPLVWPTPVRVSEHYADHIRLVTDWVEYRRISPKEMQCIRSATPREQGVGEGAVVRMIADIHRIPGEDGKIVVFFDTRGLTRCMLSPLATDRLAAFRFDVWNVANRTGAIGVPGIRLVR